MSNDNHDNRGDQDQDAEGELPSLDNISERLEETKRHMADLERQLKMARGTKKLDADKFPKTLDQLIEDTLRKRLATLDEVAREVNGPVGKVAEALTNMKKQGKVHNVGSEERQVWTWRPGDMVPASELEVYVRRLIGWTPLTLVELIAATGARNSRVSGAIVAIQRSGDQVVDVMGTGARSRWFLMTPSNTRDARLDPKPPKKR